MFYLQESSFGPVIMRQAEGAKMYIPNDPDNADYQAYIAWCQEGNVATPVEQPGSLINADSIRRTTAPSVQSHHSSEVIYVENDIAADRRAAEAQSEYLARVAAVSQVAFSVSRRMRR